VQTFTIDQIQEMLKGLNWTALQNTAELIKKGAKLYVPDELDYEESNADSICLLGIPHKLIRPTTIDQVWTENLTLDGLGWDYMDNPENRQNGYGQLLPHYLDFVIQKIVEKHGLGIPSNKDWDALINSVQGNALALMDKSMGGTNKSDFGVLLTGYRGWEDSDNRCSSLFFDRGKQAFFWSSSCLDYTVPDHIGAASTFSTSIWVQEFAKTTKNLVTRDCTSRSWGFSMRCVKFINHYYI
jgi:uncharacterized protein (TIGR02145 family)